MKKSICCIALALVMALSTVGLFASCAKEKEKTLVMATNANFPPYEYKDGAAFAGIDVELAQAIADKLGMKLEIQDVEFGAIVAGVESGKYDIGMAMYKLNEAYQDKFSFYIYYQDKLKTLDEWIRETDLSESFYFGGTLDYHF